MTKNCFLIPITLQQVCFFFLQRVWDNFRFVVVVDIQSLYRGQLCDLKDCSLPGFSVHGIFLARMLQQIATPFSRGSSQPRDQTALAGRFFTAEPSGKTIQIPEFQISPVENFYFIFMNLPQLYLETPVPSQPSLHDASKTISFITLRVSTVCLFSSFYLSLLK